MQTPGPGSRDTGSGQDTENDNVDASRPGSAWEDGHDQGEVVELPSKAATLEFTLLPLDGIILDCPAEQQTAPDDAGIWTE